MGMILVNPDALMDYADWVRPKVLRVDTDAYGAAVGAFLSAPDNDFGTGGVTNAEGTVDAEVEDVERHNLVAEQFAGAVRSLDSDRASFRDGTVVFDLDHASFVALRAAWSMLGVGEDLVEEAEDIQATQYANDITDVLADDGVDSADTRAEVERLLAEMEADGIGDDPSAQRAFVLTLGGEGLTALNDAAAFAESNGGDSWLGPITQVSTYVATTANRLSASDLRDFVEELPGSVLFMNARLTPWDDVATMVAVERLWGQDDFPMIAATWPSSFVATMGQGDDLANWELLPNTWRAAAAGVVADNPQVAHDFLTATSDEGRERLRTMVYDVDHAFAGDALVAGLRDSPGSLFDANEGNGHGSLAFQQTHAETEDAFAWLVDHHETTDDGWFNGEDGMTDPSRVALAHVGGMFLPDLAIIGGVREGGDGAFSTVSRDDVVYFYDQLFDSTDAQQVVSAQLGAFTRTEWERAVTEFRETSEVRDLTHLRGATGEADDLSDIWSEALADDGAEDAEVRNFWVGVGKATAGAVSAIGIAASPATGGTSIALGAGASWTIAQIADSVPVPTFDAAAVAADERLRSEYDAIQLLVNHGDVLDINHEPSGRLDWGLTSDQLAQFRDPGFWEDQVYSTDSATRIEARAQIQGVLNNSEQLGSAVEAVTGEIRNASEGQG